MLFTLSNALINSVKLAAFHIATLTVNSPLSTITCRRMSTTLWRFLILKIQISLVLLNTCTSKEVVIEKKTLQVHVHALSYKESSIKEFHVYLVIWHPEKTSQVWGFSYLSPLNINISSNMPLNPSFLGSLWPFFYFLLAFIKIPGSLKINVLTKCLTLLLCWILSPQKP